MKDESFKEYVRKTGINSFTDYSTLYDKVCQISPFADGTIFDVDPIQVKIESPISSRYRGSYKPLGLHSISLTNFAKEGDNLYSEAFVRPHDEIYRIMDEEKKNGKDYFNAIIEGELVAIVTFEDIVEGDVIRHEARLPLIDIQNVKKI